MNDETIEEMKGRLEEMRENIRTRLDMEREEFDDLLQDLEVKDYVEQADEDFDRRLTGRLGLQDRERLKMVLSALRRIETGEYGICNNCGAPIGEERLRAKPEAVLCINCKERLEAGK
jgi:DnaK suppressor protein